jgi:tetratricopeptide (TPR) repeat protein
MSHEERATIVLPAEAEVLTEARAACRQLLDADPGRGDALHLLALMAARDGEHRLAVSYARRAARIDARDPVRLVEFASLLDRTGHHDQAVSACLCALRLDPDRVEIYEQLAKSLSHGQHSKEALAVYRVYLKLRTDDETAPSAFDDLLSERNRKNGAYESAVTNPAQGADTPDACLQFGHAALKRQAWTSAADAFTEGIRLDNGRADLHLGLGRARMGAGAIAEAVEAFRRALTCDSISADACSQLVCALELLGRRADGARAWLHLGIALQARDLFQGAVAAYRQAIAREPNCLDAHLRLGSLLLTNGEAVEALAHLRIAVGIDPEHIGAHFKLAMALHQTGQSDAGWEEFRWLYHPQRIKSWRLFEQPIWDGTSLEGCTVLLWSGLDYGFGDTIHGVRYADALKRRGARVIVECQKAMTPLVESARGADGVVTQAGPLPAFDIHAPMMWVPIIDPSLRPPGAIEGPYLSAREPLVKQWRQRIGDGPCNVGLCWVGKATRKDARQRFTSLAAFAPLGQVSGVRFISLQLGTAADERFCAPSRMHIVSILADDCSIADTAAVVSNLDLVITVDTLIANLAGAIGNPVWTIVPFGADWKWGLSGDRTEWYPTMRLFRQTRRGDWTEVMERVGCALEAWAAERQTAAS